MSSPRALRLNPQDNIVVAIDEMRPGDVPAGVVSTGDGQAPVCLGALKRSRTSLIGMDYHGHQVTPERFP